MAREGKKEERNERNEERVTLQRVLVWRYLQKTEEWSSLTDVAAGLEGRTAPRTVRAHAVRLYEQGLLERSPTFPHLYRIASPVPRGALSLARDLEKMVMVYGEECEP